MTIKLTLTVTLTLTDTVKVISQTKLGGELLPERPLCVGLNVTCTSDRLVEYTTVTIARRQSSEPEAEIVGRSRDRSHQLVVS